MPSLTRRQSTSKSSKSSKSSRSKDSGSNESGSRRSSESYGSQSTTPTSLYTSPRPSDVKSSRSSSGSGPKRERSYECCAPYPDLSPATWQDPRSSADTYASTTASEEDLQNMMDLDSPMGDEYDSIPPLPVYRHEAVEPSARPSSPQDFARLFPSLDRLSIRHDEFTPDGNMNLRVDTVVTGRRRTAIQLFHLRMYDLARREFSLRRYCRDSGREVCNSKRKYVEPAAPKPPKTADTRPSLQRSVTSAIKTLGGGGGGGRPGVRRTNSGGSFFSSNSRPGTANSSCDGDDETFNNTFSRESLDSSKSAGGRTKSKRPLPTNTIKLEFSNYARVDVTRRGGSGNKRYEFDWWGHRYSWRRVVEKPSHTGYPAKSVSFHLVRDGNNANPVAHIVPETRSPNQVLADECAGGWVPPCFMWIADDSVLDAMTDVADVIMATGLMALVDDCIKEKWQPKKVHRIPVPLTSKTVDVPKALVPQIFSRRHTNSDPPPSALRYANAIPAY